MKLFAALVVVVAASLSACCTCECGGTPTETSNDLPDFPDAARASVRPELAPQFVAAAAR